MSGNVESLGARRQERPCAGPEAERVQAASGYVQRAEEALKLLPLIGDFGERAAVCRITETWLTLAEAELAKAPTPR